MSSLKYPIRINKYLAHKGYSTRKKADELVVAKKVTINGKLAMLGDKVQKGDEVKIHNLKPQKFIYLAYNKPKNIVTHGAQKNETEIKDKIKKTDKNLNVFPVGRLDKKSHGLIILTNDGRIVEPLLSPQHVHEKEYIVKVNERLRNDFEQKMSNGVDIGGYVTKKCKTKKINRNTFKIILTEGKNHQIKRMCNTLGYTVNDLKRIRIMNIKLGKIPTNSFMKIKGKELKIFLNSLNIK
jgi:pseudouridine synthase